MAKLSNSSLEQKICQPHRNDDKYLEKFLRARYWKIENSYKLVNIIII